MPEQTSPLSVADFLDTRHELPDAGQWAELEAGTVVLLQPPDLDHGTTLLNLSKALAAWVHTGGAGETYACFDLGLILQQDPATVRFPAVSVYCQGPRFAEADKLATTAVPAQVVELASSAERRRQMRQRTADYFAWGVQAVWVIDPAARTVEQHEVSGAVQRLAGRDRLQGGTQLPGFELSVAELFVEPEWWTGPRRR